MTTYAFRRLLSPRSSETIKSGFVRHSQAEAFAIDWLRFREYDIVDIDHTDRIDFMTTRAGKMYQFIVVAE